MYISGCRSYRVSMFQRIFLKKSQFIVISDEKKEILKKTISAKKSVKRTVRLQPRKTLTLGLNKQTNVLEHASQMMQVKIRDKNKIKEGL